MAADRFDALVIGAGVNGLALAIHLATKGWSVCVIEAAETAGGAVRTAEITLPGFRHDMAAMNLSMFAGSPFFRRYGEELLREGLELIAVDRPFASVFPDGTHLGVSTDLEETTSEIAALSPQDANAWRTSATSSSATRRTSSHYSGLHYLHWRPAALSSELGERSASGACFVSRGWLSPLLGASLPGDFMRKTPRCAGCLGDAPRLRPRACRHPAWPR